MMSGFFYTGTTNAHLRFEYWRKFHRHINSRKKGIWHYYNHNSSNETTVHLFGTTKITTTLKVVFNKGILQSSNYLIEKNGRPYDNTTITLNNRVYTINHAGAILT